ncbi:hypothetical protein EV191_103215 [Tamaricihabitans halophyticus]|uniref:Uncharacterized protein n=1 Tax=Tamaricihabitans halophyticus TaxID=1262583 RepID=A0A4R2QXT1_9PSEU|nr:hypothetical protein [Tamaricihabitans halophyticus]TCP54174.1 hypothetical protein EV191_103215 [Tamaricihabitans halophyticus]
MDDRQVTELMRDAAQDTPPASFDVPEVLAASARARARQRARVFGGATVGVVLLAGGVFVGSTVFTGTDQEIAGSAAQPAEQEAGQAPYAEQPRQENVPTPSPKQGGEGSGDVGPRTGGTPDGCAQVDRELAVALAGELPATPGAAERGSLRCVAEDRVAGFEISDGAAKGTISVLLRPAEVADQDSPPWSAAPEAAAHVQRATANGDTLVVLTEPAQGSAGPPLADQLESLAARLAAKF